MANPNQPQPELKPTAAANQPPATPAAQDTKRPSDSVPMATGTFAKLPMRFGRYQVEKLLGRGAMGAVYLARDTQLERLVALKIPKLSGSGAAKLLQRLKTEAKAAAQIDHPSVCPVYDAGDIDGTSYIAMQYIEGETLKDCLQKQTHTPAEVVNLILHLAEGLAEAHARGIYHRDLKPENVKVNRRGVPVIMDFGLAKLAATVSADAGKTQSGTILGSPAYMSPEQAGGKVEEVDHRSDLYSLGVMLFEMLTGQWPFTGGAMQVMGQKSVLEPPSPLTIKPELNPQLAAVCHKLIAKKREDRYQTAKDVIAALKALDMGTGTQGSSSSIPAAQSPSAIASPFPAFEQDDAFSSMIARKRQEANRRVGAAKLGSKTHGITQSAARWWRGQPRGVKWTGLAVSVLLLGLIGLWAGGIFVKVQTKEGILVIDVNEPGAEVYVDGEQVEVSWDNGKKKATVEIKPGERRVEVKKDGFAVTGKKLTFKEGKRVVFKARLQPKNVAAKTEDTLPPMFKNSLGMEFILVPKGKSWLGGGSGKLGDQAVEIRQDLYLGKYEVTQEEWEKVTGANPSHFSRNGGGQDAVKDTSDADLKRFPVENVSWNEAQLFLKVLNAQEKEVGWVYRLPKAAEWEYACRGGPMADRFNSAFDFYFDKPTNQLQPDQANVAESGKNRACKVGSYNPNPLRLYDMHGNVYEWCDDSQKAAGGAADRVYRGGNWFHGSRGSHAAFRGAITPSWRDHHLGIRLARVPVGKDGEKDTLPRP